MGALVSGCCLGGHSGLLGSSERLVLLKLQLCGARPREVGSLATGLDTFTFLLIHYLGKRFLEVFILVLVFLLPVLHAVADLSFPHELSVSGCWSATW